MNNQGFWNKLEKTCHIEDTGEQLFALGDLLKQAYMENLNLICLCIFEEARPGMAKQGFLEYEEGRFLMCYSSFEHADREPRRLPCNVHGIYCQPCQLPVRTVIDHLFLRDVTVGLVFNSDDPDAMMILPKAMLEGVRKKKASSRPHCRLEARRA